MNSWSFILQTVLVCGALYLVWRVLDWFRTVDAISWRIVSLGFLLRAGAGIAAFASSYLGVPAVRGYILGHGLWFFARDGALYVMHARDLAEHALPGILFARFMPSVSYVQALGFFCWLFGGAVSVGILLNLFAYLGSCAVIVCWSDASGRRAGKGARLTLALLSFSPAMILWATQPLKDTMFAFLVVIAFWSLSSWRLRLNECGTQRSHVVIFGLVFVLAIGLMAGTRWYFAILVLVAATLFHIVRVVIDRERRAFAIVGAAMILILAGQLIAITGGSFVPRPYREILSLGLNSAWGQPYRSLDEHREGFLETEASTQIRPGFLVRGFIRYDTDEANRSSESSEVRDRTEPGPTSGWIAGMSSILIPRFIGVHVGLFEIGGGRGLWWFADMDTLFIDASILLVIALLWKNRWAGWYRDPLALTMILLSIGMVALLGYVVTNFGTMMRLRLPVFLLSASLPVQVAASIHGEKRRAYDACRKNDEESWERK